MKQKVIKITIIDNKISSRIENPEIYQHRFNHLVFDKGTKAIQRKRDSLFNKWS